MVQVQCVLEFIVSFTIIEILVVFQIYFIFELISGSYIAEKDEGVKKITRWSLPRAIEWYSKLPEWISGCNFLPSTAINQVLAHLGSTLFRSKICFCGILD